MHCLSPGTSHQKKTGGLHNTMSLFWKKMKALFLQTKICEASQIRINMNHLCLVVNKRLLRVETSNQMWWRKQFSVQHPISIFNFSMWHSIIPLETTTSFTRHIIVCDAVAFPNQVVGGRESLLNKGNFFRTCVYIFSTFSGITFTVGTRCRLRFAAPILFGHTVFHRGWFGYVHLQFFLLFPGWKLIQVQANNFG